ncbi:hypothetical protein A1O3_03711 [Capronia epimyces CBS 606.96]|uniref:AB hydrolase-1 domain-containing protein n=1 Tax=Capronia epimyces CBS 606.96 TaxID=1182542 RepID=W9Y1R7_9EURO|nr:uncharacterized protein A1O3_03711 [Capronia epimyces CBS 606.96]EXJ86757.1 hypothetical protein A1O3_03711 [Capronia epimyces CBS 606.96]
MPPSIDPPGTLIHHANGQTSHVMIDDFTDPWLAHETETILIQPGFARHAAFWYHWIPALSREYRVVRRDSRGHGWSSAPAPTPTRPPQPEDDDTSEPPYDYDWSVDTICDEIIDCLDQLSIAKVHFLGESTSGMIGEILAAKYPHRLRSLTICSSPTFLPPPALELFAFGHRDWPTACRELGPRAWGEALSKVPGTVSVPDPAYLLWWIDQIALSSPDGLAGYAGFLSTLDSRPYLAQIRLPMLILAPAKSAATTLEEQRKIAQSVKNSRIEVIHGTGHEIYVEMPHECQAAVLDFLKSLKQKP